MKRITALLVGVLALGGGPAAAQNTPATPAPDAPKPLEIGAIAPDFELPGATRYGVLAQPVRLSDFKGKTVVLAFFFKARTRG
jgi:cytochrome oxidase Cu insertion factor (SCO1/SenC/PrrC family)